MEGEPRLEPWCPSPPFEEQRHLGQEEGQGGRVSEAVSQRPEDFREEGSSHQHQILS